jgi:granule-bound starch synthase
VWGKTGSKLYGARSGADYVDNHKRFTLFCKAAIESVKVLPFGPGEDCVFVANDWHSGLVPLLIKVRIQYSLAVRVPLSWYSPVVLAPRLFPRPSP